MPSVFVALGTQREKRMRHVVVCDLPGSTNSPTLSHIWQDLKKKHKTRFSIFSTFLPEKFSS